MNIITIELLKKLNACPEGIKFFKRNKLEGFPVDKLDEVKGDYDDFVRQIKREINIERKYDENGNKIYEKCYYWECRYDEDGNMTFCKFPGGDEYYYAYYPDGQLKSINDTLYIPYFDK